MSEPLSLTQNQKVFLVFEAKLAQLDKESALEERIFPESELPYSRDKIERAIVQTYSHSVDPQQKAALESYARDLARFVSNEDYALLLSLKHISDQDSNVISVDDKLKAIAIYERVAECTKAYKKIMNAQPIDPAAN